MAKKIYGHVQGRWMEISCIVFKRMIKCDNRSKDVYIHRKVETQINKYTDEFSFCIADTLCSKNLPVVMRFKLLLLMENSPAD